ncbi:MAG: hypothetical protein ACT4OX_04560 [Actinomycetota bacterium]
MNLLIVEMRRALHRRLVRWMIVLALVGCAFLGVVALVSSGDLSALDRAYGHPALMESWYRAGTGDGMNGIAASFLAIGAVVCAASVAGAEWKAGTVTTVLTWVPSRVRLHAARTVSAAILAFVISLALQVVLMLAATPAVVVNGETTGTDQHWWFGLLAATLRVSLITALIAVLALSIATIGRNTGAALVALAAWALVIEGLIRGLKPGLARFLIGENVVIVVPWAPLEDAEFQRGPVLALVTLLVYLTVICFAAGLSFTRRDIVASA